MKLHKKRIGKFVNQSETEHVTIFLGGGWKLNQESVLRGALNFGNVLNVAQKISEGSKERDSKSVAGIICLKG